jgi:hypothetical protein
VAADDGNEKEEEYGTVPMASPRQPFGCQRQQACAEILRRRPWAERRRAGQGVGVFGAAGAEVAQARGALHGALVVSPPPPLATGLPPPRPVPSSGRDGGVPTRKDGARQRRITALLN